MIFAQGKNIPLDLSSDNMPNVAGAMLNWNSKMTFRKIVKTIVDFKVVETVTDLVFEGVWQPASPQSLMMKPEGQRSWKWFTLHAKPSLVLITDEVIIYREVKYRVQGKTDYSANGYLQYDLTEDYE